MEMKRNFDCTPLESASRETHRGDLGQEAAEPARHSDAVCQQVRFFAPREQKSSAGGLDWMVRIAERMLRKWPKAITFVCSPLLRGFVHVISGVAAGYPLYAVMG